IQPVTMRRFPSRCFVWLSYRNQFHSLHLGIDPDMVRAHVPGADDGRFDHGISPPKKSRSPAFRRKRPLTIPSTSYERFRPKAGLRTFHCFSVSQRDMNDSSENPWVRPLPACWSTQTINCDENGYLRTPARRKRAYPGSIAITPPTSTVE